MMGEKAALVAVIFFSVTAHSVATEDAILEDGPHLRPKPPGMTAEVVAPGLIPENEWMGCAGFLNEGRIFVQQHSRQDLLS